MKQFGADCARELLAESATIMARLRDSILSEMARTLFVTSYADAWDNKELPPKAPHAGSGDEWFACAPQETPLAARKLADALVAAIEEHDKVRVEEVFQRNAALTEGHLREPTAESFGYCLAMECLGHGVGWADDHPEHEFNLPLVEAWLEIYTAMPKPTAEGMVHLDEHDGGPLWLDLDHTGHRFFGDEGVEPPFKTVCTVTPCEPTR